MDYLLLSALALGFLSGFRHAFEPDHIVAVSTLLRNEPKPLRALRLGLAWGAGHTTMLVIAVGIIGVLRVQISESHLAYFELPVAVVMIVLGVLAMVDALRIFQSRSMHTHDDIEHIHVGAHAHPHGFDVNQSGWKGFVVGLVHGLAGSGALVMLAAASLPTTGAGLLYALVLGLGSILGMGAVTLLLAFPFAASHSHPGLYAGLRGIAGALSLFIGGGILVALLF
jgi:high-affinity nickel permease